MAHIHSTLNRRVFFKAAATLTALPGLGIASSEPSPNPLTEASWSIVGPREGFTPHVGTIYSMLAMMRHQILQPVQGMSVEQLDYLHDGHANSIGAMLWHMAATETYFQMNTFENIKWGSWPDDIAEKWDTPMKLGEDARKKIKGNRLEFYLDILAKVREKTTTELKKRDDEWLMRVDPDWGWNNYAKWFHVAEHESNHNGQIKWIKSRLPGAKPSKD